MHIAAISHPFSLMRIEKNSWTPQFLPPILLLRSVEDGARTRRNYFCCKGTSLSDLAPATWWETSKRVLSRPRPSGIENDFEGTNGSTDVTAARLSFPFQSEPTGKNSLSEEIFWSWLRAIKQRLSALLILRNYCPSRSFIKISRVPKTSNANSPFYDFY